MDKNQLAVLVKEAIVDNLSFLKLVKYIFQKLVDFFWPLEKVAQVILKGAKVEVI